MSLLQGTTTSFILQNFRINSGSTMTKLGIHYLEEGLPSTSPGLYEETLVGTVSSYSEASLSETLLGFLLMGITYELLMLLDCSEGGLWHQLTISDSR